MVRQEVDFNVLEVMVPIRDREGFIINGVECEDGSLVPFSEGDNWCPRIDLDEGEVIGWPSNAEADIQAYVGDAGSYYLIDECEGYMESFEEVAVPRMLSGGTRNSIVMKIDKDGKIANWKPSFKGLMTDDL